MDKGTMFTTITDFMEKSYKADKTEDYTDFITYLKDNNFTVNKHHVFKTQNIIDYTFFNKTWLIHVTLKKETLIIDYKLQEKWLPHFMIESNGLSKSSPYRIGVERVELVSCKKFDKLMKACLKEIGA